MSSGKIKIVVGGIVLIVAAALTVLFSDSMRGRPRLPVGNRTPAIALGSRHGLILASDGSLWTWGSDFLGWPVLGLEDGPLQSRRLRRIGKDTNWVSISAAESQNLALKSDGTLWTWGESSHASGARPMAIKTPTLAAPGNDWKQAAAGGVHCMAVKKDGTLWAWGNNWAGSLGIPNPKGSSTPVQVGSETNWIQVWAGLLETVAMKSDHSLWYCGDNPDPRIDQRSGQIFTPTRICPDTNWVDVAFGPWTVLAIKSDGTLWSWGRNAEAFTGAKDTSLNSVPTRVGTGSDWRSFSSSGDWWWCVGLTKTDGSLWMLDASNGKPNGPAEGEKHLVSFRRIEFQKDFVAGASGSAHAAPPGIHGPVGVVLTREGEVWTWGMVLGDSSSFLNELTHRDPDPVFRDKPWLLRNRE